MFGSTRASLEAIQTSLRLLIAALESTAVPPDNEGLAALRERLDEIDLSRKKWEAEMEAVLLKAKAQYSAANNAEARARTQRAHYEKDAVEVGEDGEGTYPEEAWQRHPDYLQGGNAEGGPGDGVQPLHLGVEDGDPKARALRGKFS